MSDASYEVDGTSFKLLANAHNQTSLFNGGDEGWGRQTWDIATHIENSITFVLFDHQWNGFPGIFASCLTHTVTPHQWRVAFGVTPLLKPGPINLSQQVFFNLDGFKSNASDNTILSHELRLPNAGFRFDLDAKGIPTGDLKSNSKGGQHDYWSASRRVGDGLGQKRSVNQTGLSESGSCETPGTTDCMLDTMYMLSHRLLGAKEDAPAAILSSANSGVTMELYTDHDALHVHTWENSGQGKSHFVSSSMLTKRRAGDSLQQLTTHCLHIDDIQLKKGQGTGPVPVHGAVSLEMQDWPDGVNHPEWLNRKTIWGMDGLYTSFATYKFSVNNSKKNPDRA